MREEGGGLVRREGCGAGYLGAVLRLTASWARSKRRKLQGCVKESPPTRCGAVPELAGAAGGQAKYPRARHGRCSARTPNSSSPWPRRLLAKLTRRGELYTKSGSLSAGQHPGHPTPHTKDIAHNQPRRAAVKHACSVQFPAVPQRHATTIPGRTPRAEQGRFWRGQDSFLKQLTLAA